MPDYNFTLTVPANTSKDTPQTVEMKLKRGAIASGLLQFPAGCHGLVYVVIVDGKHQLYPANAGETYHGDNIAIPIVGKHVLDSAPYKLWIKGWSPNTSYDHTIQLAIAILEEGEASPYKALSDLLAILKRIMGLK